MPCPPGADNSTALVLHMARVEGRRLVEEGLLLRGWQAEDNAWLTQAVAKRAV